MKGHFRAGMLAVAFVATLAACEGLHVKSDVNSALIGSVQCHSFAWAGSFQGSTPLRGTIANPVNESRLRAAIAAHLQLLGMQQVQTNPDCLVGYGIGYRNVIEGWYPDPYWGPWGPWGPWGYWGGPGYGPYVYHEGIIAVDLYEARGHQPLWHASVNQSLVGSEGAEADKRINEAVAALFTKYPGRI